MLEKNVRKNYYEYFNSYELIRKELVEFLYSEDIFLDKKSKNEIKKDFKKYLKNINILTETINNQINKKKIQREEYHKMINSSLDTINKKQIKLEKTFNNLLDNEFEKFYYCKKNLYKIFKQHKKIIILINMYSSFKSFIYDYDTAKLKNLSTQSLKKGDIILSLKSEKKINENLFFKLISKITRSRIGHSTIFLEENKSGKAIYIDIKNGDTTVKNLLTNSKNIKYVKTHNKYSNDVIGLVLRIKGGLSKLEEQKITIYIENQINLEYGTLKVLTALIIGKIYEKLPFKNLTLKHPDQNLKTMFCSEFVIRTYEAAQIYLGNKTDPAVTSPADLLNSPQLEILGYINN